MDCEVCAKLQTIYRTRNENEFCVASGTRPFQTGFAGRVLEDGSFLRSFIILSLISCSLSAFLPKRPVSEVYGLLLDFCWILCCARVLSVTFLSMCDWLLNFEGTYVMLRNVSDFPLNDSLSEVMY